MISLEALRVLDAIDRNRSFSLAAEELRRAPSAVTYVIQQLEARLNVQIFDRSGHRAVLTKAGRYLLDEGRLLLAQAAHLEKSLQMGVSQGLSTLSIAYDQLLSEEMMGVIIRDFLAHYRDLQICLRAEVLNGAWDALASGRCDVVIGATGEPPLDLDCHAEPLTQVGFVFAVAPDHPLASVGHPLGFQEIQAHRAVILKDSSTKLQPLTTGIAGGKGAIHVFSMQEKLALQLQGVGVGFLPCYLAEPFVRSGRLLIKGVQRPKAPAKLKIAWSPKVTGLEVSQLVHCIRQHIGGKL